MESWMGMSGPRKRLEKKSNVNYPDSTNGSRVARENREKTTR